jgi:hypothetical protein
MKSGTIRRLLGVMLVAGFSLIAWAEIKENPYQVIIDRNPFALKPIPPPPPPPPPPVETNTPPAAPEVKLTGITTLLGAPKAFLQVEDKQAKPAKMEFPPALAVGGTFKTLEVLAIDVDAGTVKVRIGDTESTLDFINNGVKSAAAAAAPAPHPGVIPPIPGQTVPGMPGAVNPAGANTGRGAIIGGGAPTIPNPANPGAMAGYNPALGGGVPPRPIRTDNYLISGGSGQPNLPSVQPTVQPAMSSMDAQAIIELKRQELQAREAAGQLQRGQPSSRIMPPTALGNALRTAPPAPQ